MDIEELFLNTFQAIYEKPIASSIILYGEKLEAFPLDNDVHSHYIQYSPRSLGRANRQEKEIEPIQTEKYW